MAVSAVTGARGRIGVALFALVVAMGMGCAERRARKAPQPNNPATITAEDRFTAMMSVHAYAYHRAGILPLTADKLDLPSLRRIVAILTEDRDPFATSRRRRAVAQLAAYAGTTDPTDELVQTWQALLFNDPQLIRSVDEALAGLIHKVDPTEIEKAIYNLLKGLTTPYVEKGAIVSPGTHPTMETPPLCTTSDPLFLPPVAQSTGEIDVRVEITVGNASPSVVSQRIDPQNWAHCPYYGDLSFTKAYLTTDTATPTSTCPIPNPPTPPDPAANNAKPLGSAYDNNATLFEDFVCAGACNAEYKNLLAINTIIAVSPCGDGMNTCDGSGASGPANPVPYEACYSLATPLVGCLGGQLVHLLVDQGDLTACDKSPNTRVVSRKGIKLQEYIANWGYAYALLWVGQAEATQMLAEVVCCAP